MIANNRRYDIDWLRVIAIWLLLIYHIAIGFQPWGLLIGFIQNEQSMPNLWIPMTMLNVWRIPLLFFVSGMGVFFALRKRSWKQLLLERTKRILVPFVFGIIAIAPIHAFLIMKYYEQPISYVANAGHLWFLGNIFSYVLILLPLFYFLKKHENGKLSQGIKKVFSSPLGLLLAIGIMVAEAFIVKPNPFELYALTLHGYILGFLAFLLGFCFVYSGQQFWNNILKLRWIFLVIAFGLYAYRYFESNLVAPGYLLSIESCLWIFSAFGFAYKYLNKPSKALSYMSQAVYPVYIIHMAFLYGASYLIFPLDLPVMIQFVLVVIITIAGCFGTYEFVIKRVNILRPLFGLKPISIKAPNPMVESAVE